MTGHNQQLLAEIEKSHQLSTLVFLAKSLGRTLFIVACLCSIALNATAQDAPAITSQPQDATAQTGDQITFSVAATGSAPLSYQWFWGNYQLGNDSRFSGETTSNLTVVSANYREVGSYFVIVTNAYGSVTSSAALLKTAPVFIAPPAAHSAPVGASTTFSATAQGTTPIYYHWQFNGTDIPGALSSTFTISNVKQTNYGSYTVVATNSVGTITSDVAVLTPGPVACWGNNSYGQCSPPPDLTNITAISCGYRGTESLQVDGIVRLWGALYPLPTIPTIPTIPTMTNAVAVSAYDLDEYAAYEDGGAVLAADGTVVTWPQATPPGLSNIVSISCNTRSFVALRRNGTVFSRWLTNTMLTHIKAISAGDDQNLALRDDGTVFAWPSAYLDGPTNVPANVKDIIAIASGGAHCLALNSAGRVLAWGSGTGTNLPSILTKASAPRVVAIAAGEHDLALLTNGTVIAWGFNSDGQAIVPPGLSNVVAVSVGIRYSSALVNDGKPVLLQPPVGGTAFHGRNFTLTSTITGTQPLYCQWSYNGANIPDATNSTLILTNAQLTDAGNYQLTVSNALGSVTSVAAPVQVIDAPPSIILQPQSVTSYVGKTVDLAVIVDGSGPLQIQWRVATTKDGTGTPIWHDLPDATNEDLVLSPALALDSGTYSVVISNAFNSVTSSNAIIVVRQVVAWGDNTSGQTNVPPTLTNAIAVAGSMNGSCVALRADGTPQTWGYCGTNPPAGISNLTEVGAVGSSDFVGLRTDGTPVTWRTPTGAYTGFTNAFASISNVVAMEADTGGVYFLLANGTITFVSSYGYTSSLTWMSNVVSLSGVAAGSGFVAVYADGTSMTPIPPYATLTNVLIVAAAPNSGATLQFDSTLQRYFSTYPAAVASNVVDIAQTSSDATFAVGADGTLLYFKYIFDIPPPPGLDHVWSVDGGKQMAVALCAANEFPRILLPTALDTHAAVVSSRHGAPWFGQTKNSHDGFHAARSAQIDKNTATSMRMLTNGPVKVSFWWKVSSETNHDFLTFSIGGVPQTAISGEVDWQRVTFDVPAGPQMLVWTYSKDADGTAGLDAAFVDQLTFTPVAPTILAQPVNTTAVGPAPAGLSVIATGTPPLKYQWFSTSGTNILSTSAALIFKPSTRASSGTYFVIVSNMVSAVQSSNATLTVHVPQKIGYPVLQSDGTFLITSQDSDASIFSTNFDPSPLQAEYSSNLIDWFPLTSALTVTNGLLQLNDPDSTNSPSRFYRILEQY